MLRREVSLPCSMAMENNFLVCHGYGRRHFGTVKQKSRENVFFNLGSYGILSFEISLETEQRAEALVYSSWQLKDEKLERGF